MALDTFKRLVDQFDRLTELHLQGLGEPMMHPHFFDMVAYAADRGITVSTNTNLTLLNARRAERCVTSGLDRLCISIDGATAATYERIRVRASLARVIRNLELLLATRDRLGSGRPRLRLVMVVMRQNLQELPELVRLAHRYEFDEFFVQHLCHDFGESTLPSQYRSMREFIQAQTLFEEDAQRVAASFAHARELAEALGVRIRLPRTQPRPHPAGTPGRQRCDWPWRGAYLSYRGDAMPCCMVATPDRINFGNMAEQGVDSIWNNQAYHEFRSQLDSDEPPEICRSCALYAGMF